LGQSHQFRDANIILQKEDIAEVRSHDHVLLQCLDIVLGSMCFRLNERHKEKEPGKHRRGKRTKAKEKIYKTILAEIRTIRPNFNIGANTGDDGIWENRWRHPYRHWCFQSKNAIYKGELTKRGQKKMRPINPT
jgi:hypothetical protein